MSEELITRGRVDLTKTLKPNQRRLDTLANLLSGKSSCVAVCVINNEFHITANEFHKTLRANHETYRWIQKVMEHFQETVLNKGKIGGAEFNKLFKEACEQRSKAYKQMPIPSDLPEKLIDDILKGDDITLEAFMKKYGKDKNIAGFLHDEFKTLHKGISKLERAIIEKRDGKSAAILTDEQFAAFKCDSLILHDETQKGVHAEVQPPLSLQLH